MWKSPISTDAILASSISISNSLASKNGLVWLESRPEEAGRSALVHRSLTGNITEIIPFNLKKDCFNARTRVHEYGGASFSAAQDGSVIFSDIVGPLFSTVLVDGAWSEPEQISPKSDVLRYADFSVHPQHSHLLLSILEDHTIDLPADVVNSVVVLNMKTKTLVTLAAGRDFYSAPRWSDDGNKVLFVSWNHPEMPWTSSSLFTVSFVDQIIGEPNYIVGGRNGNMESISQPRWNGDSIIYLSDRSGYYQLYSHSKGGEESQVLKALTASDIGGPDWTFGQSTHQKLSPTTWISKAKGGNLAITTLATQESIIIETPFDSIQDIVVVSANKLALVVSSKATSSKLIFFTIDSSSIEVLKTFSNLDTQIDPGYLSAPIEMVYPVKDGSNAYGYYFPPTNKDFSYTNEKPPCIINCHGGPTSAASNSLNWVVQYFTSRGFGYALINYGGSTGYGAEFRNRLNGNWGVVDVEDTIYAVKYLIESKGTDRDRVGIVGGSAGGFTVLAALVQSRVFTAGVSQYGVSDLQLLGSDTHKFESKYLDGLLGGSVEEIPEVYKERSPITHAEKITAPLLLLQGDIDRVVPLAQAQLMKDKIDSKGGKCEMIIFEGEGHGFRKAENRKRALEAELAFYLKTWRI